MRYIRWKLFKLLSRIGWWVCPPEDRLVLQSIMPTWDDVSAAQREEPGD